MNNELVAFVSKEDLKNMKTHLCYLHLKPQKNHIPLYAHPVKELTDEEWIITYQTWALTSNDPLVLKRAILRKASEK